MKHDQKNIVRKFHEKVAFHKGTPHLGQAKKFTMFAKVAKRIRCTFAKIRCSGPLPRLKVYVCPNKVYV